MIRPARLRQPGVFGTTRKHVARFRQSKERIGNVAARIAATAQARSLHSLGL